MEGYNEGGEQRERRVRRVQYNDATAGTTKGREQEEPHHNLQRRKRTRICRSHLIDMGVFKPTSGNATKRLRMRQETRETTIRRAIQDKVKRFLIE